MTRVATSGTHSCAAISISGFGDKDRQMEEEYIRDGEFYYTSNKTVYWFYNKILYPTTQPLGKSESVPFSFLMKELDENGMKNKYMTAVLNVEQIFDGYWIKKLKEHGFKMMDETFNDIGMMCYIFIRNFGRPLKSSIEEYAQTVIQ